MDALVITLREGLEAALVIGVIYALVKRSGRTDLMRWVVGGVVAAALFSVVAAVALSTLGLSADNPTVEGVTLLIAAVAVISMVVWVWRNGRTMRGSVEARVGGIMGGSSRTPSGLALFALSFFMVAREGAELVLFMSALALGGASEIGLLLGGLAGLTLAVVYGILFARGSVRIDLKLFFTMTAAVLVLLAIKLLGGSIHEFEEAGLIPMSETLAHFFDWFAASTAIDWLFLAALIVPLVAPLLKRRGGTPTGQPRLNGR